MSPISVHDLGAYLREQRQSAQLSLRQLSELAGVSNPYLSQIERGLKRPSAEILQQLARGLQVSAESLYVRAGILDEAHGAPDDAPGVLDAIAKDPKLTDRQRAVLADVYLSFAGSIPPERDSRQPARRRVPGPPAATTSTTATPPTSTTATPPASTTTTTPASTTTK